MRYWRRCDNNQACCKNPCNDSYHEIGSFFCYCQLPALIREYLANKGLMFTVRFQNLNMLVELKTYTRSVSCLIVHKFVDITIK